MALLNALLLSGLGLAVVTWLSPERRQHWIMILGTAIFLGVVAPFSLLLLTLTTLSSYYLFQSGLSLTTAVLLLLLQNVTLFAFYKTGAGAALAGPGDRLVPLGLSYYAFRQIHYGFERFKGKLPPHSLTDYVGYLFFLPTVLIGPIHRFGPYLRNAFRRRRDAQQWSEGLTRILYGYAKIVLIGQLLISTYWQLWAEGLADHAPRWSAYWTLVCFYLDTYFQFAGYSDVAIGLALLLGYRVMENFHYPLLARNINDFWNRWHISLSSWVREYVFFPVTSITRQPVAGILMTMLVIGLWHEISGRYVAWGAYHGLGIAVWHLYNRSQVSNWLRTHLPGYRGLAILLTFQFVLFSFVIVREDNWRLMWQTYQFILFGKFE